jgi:hypothetical protein
MPQDECRCGSARKGKTYPCPLHNKPKEEQLAPNHDSIPALHAKNKHLRAALHAIKHIEPPECARRMATDALDEAYEAVEREKARWNEYRAELGK